MEGYVLVVKDTDEDRRWAEGPYPAPLAMAHRNYFWDLEPGRYSIEMIRYGRPGNETRSNEDG